MQCLTSNIILPSLTGKSLSAGKMSLPGIFIVPTVNLIFPVCRVVQEIPHQRMSQICHMHADLVGSPGLQLKFHQTSELLCISGLPSGQNPVMRHRPVSPLKIHHASQTAILLSFNRGIHDTRNRHNLSLHNRKIRPVNPGCF